MKRLFSFILFIFSLLFFPESYARIYASIVMHNKELGKTVICLPDNHVPVENSQADDEVSTKDNHYTFKISRAEYDVVCQQQQGLLELIKNLHATNCSVHVLVEDIATILLQNDERIPKILGIIPKDLVEEPTPVWHSPLLFLEDFLHENKVHCTNIELRNPYDENATAAAIEHTEKNTDDEAIELLELIYKGRNIKPHIIATDAHIINKIRDLNQQIIIVAAGGSHINTISKVLYQLYGYTKTYVFFASELDEIRKKLLTAFDKNESFVGKVNDEELPPHVENLSDLVFAQLIFSSLPLWFQWHESLMQHIFTQSTVYAHLFPELNRTNFLASSTLPNTIT